MFLLIFVLKGYKQCVVPWVVAVLMPEGLGTEVLADFRDTTWNNSGNIILKRVNQPPQEDGSFRQRFAVLMWGLCWCLWLTQKPKQSRKQQNWLLCQIFWLLSVVGNQGREAPRTHFGLFLPLWARRASKAQMTPVADKSFRKSVAVIIWCFMSKWQSRLFSETFATTFDNVPQFYDISCSSCCLILVYLLF